MGYRNFQIRCVFTEYDLFKTLKYIPYQLYKFWYNVETVRTLSLLVFNGLFGGRPLTFSFWFRTNIPDYNGAVKCLFDFNIKYLIHILYT